MSCCAATLGNSDYLKETARRSARLEEERIIAASVELSQGRYKTEFVVPDMHCAACIGTIECGIAELPLVEQVRANLSLKSVSVIWNKSHDSCLSIVQRFSELGFNQHLADGIEADDQRDTTSRSLLLSLAVAGFAAANIMLLSVSVWSGADQETAQLFHLLSGLIAIPAVAFAGRPFFASAAKALSARRLNMDVPISLAVILATIMSIYESLTGGEEAYFDASVTLLFFLLIGRYLDHLMRQKARGAVERLSSLSAKNGVLVGKDGELEHIALKDIQPGMRLRIFAGERFPVNGTIVMGTSDLDRSHVTGESESAPVHEDDIVEAGTLNLTASIDIEATSSADGSFLAEMRKMMEVAEQGRGDYVRIADRMARIYAPAVHLLAFITFIAWMVLSSGDWHTSIYTAIAVLIVTCPCALGLAVPVAHVIGANRLMQNGVLMRDGTGLERLANIDAVLFDKTGTLTQGRPHVTQVDGLNDELAPVLKAIANVSSHPLSQAISSFFGDVETAKLHDVSEFPGLGVEAQFDGKKVRLGKPDWVAEIATPERQNCKKSSVCFAIEGSAPIHFETEDEVRTGANETVGLLTQRLQHVAMLSGDRKSKVEQLAGALGIQCWHADQTPADKINHVRQMARSGKKTLMVGDGINDAPALAAAHVSMVPASASDVGRHASDFVFTRSSLLAVPFAHQVACQTDRIVRQNFGLAIAYNCIAVPLAMAGFVTPLVAAIAMSASSIAVVVNSFRINLATRQKEGDPVGVQQHSNMIAEGAE